MTEEIAEYGVRAPSLEAIHAIQEDRRQDSNVPDLKAQGPEQK